MWILYLNDMRFPKIEMTVAVARANTREALVAFLERERVESYRDERDDGLHWGKVHRKGGPLEWFNRPYDFKIEEGRVFVDMDAEMPVLREIHHLTVADEAKIREQIMELPEVSDV